MIQLDPRITFIPGFIDSDLWMLTKLAAHYAKYGRAFPKIETLQKMTGYGRNKVINVISHLVELGLVDRKHRYRRSGGNTSNEYKITTRMIGYLVPMEGHEFGTTNGSSTEFENQTAQDDVVEATPDHQNEQPQEVPQRKNQENHGVPKINSAGFENQTVYIDNSISLTTTNKKDVRKATKKLLTNTSEPYARRITTCGVTSDLFDLLLDEVEQKNPGITDPARLASLSCRFAFHFMSRIRNERVQLKNQEYANQLAQQRIQDYHTKKNDNIAKIGQSKSKTGYSKPEPLHVIDAGEYWLRSEFEAEIEGCNAEGIVHRIVQPSLSRERIWDEAEPRASGIPSELLKPITTQALSQSNH